MRYCARCHIGTFDSQGLCVLCGAPAEKSTGLRRAGEAVGDTLSLLLGPVGLGVLGVALLVLLAVALPHLKAGPVPGPHSVLLSNPSRFVTDVRANPLQAVAGLLLPAVAEVAVILLILVVALLLLRRARGSGSPPNGAASFQNAAETY